MAVKYGQLAIPDAATFKSANNIASTDSNGKLVLAQSPLTAGENITISSQGVISSTGGGSKFELINEDINVNNRTAEVLINPANVDATISQSIRLTTAETNKGTIDLWAAGESGIGPELKLSSNNYTNVVTLTAGDENQIGFNIETSQQESIRTLRIGEYIKVASEISAFNRYNQNESSWMFGAGSYGKEFSVANQFTTSVFDSSSGSNESLALSHIFRPIHGYLGGTPETTDIFRNNTETPYRSLADALMQIEWPSVNFHTNNSIDINNYDRRILKREEGKSYPNVMKVHGYYVARIYGIGSDGKTIPYDGLSKTARLYLAYSLPLIEGSNEIDLDKIWNQDPTDLPKDSVYTEILRQFANQRDNSNDASTDKVIPIDESIANQYSFYGSFHYPYCFSIKDISQGQEYIDVVVNSDLNALFDDSTNNFLPFKKPNSASYYAWRFACFPSDPNWDMYKKGYDYESIEFTINSFALGFNHQATGFMAFTTGQGNKVLDSFSGAFGVNNTVAGYGSFTFGTSNTVVGESSNVNGNRNTVKGASLYAIGLRNQVTGYPIVSTTTDGTLGGSVAIGMGNSITFSGVTGRANYGQSYCFGTKLSTTRPNQLILGWANADVTGSSDTNHQIIFGVGDFNGATVTKRNAMVMDATGISFKLPVKGTLKLNDNLNIPNSYIAVGSCINISSGSNGWISVGPNNSIYKTCVAIGENNVADDTDGLSYRLLVGAGNKTDGQNTVCLGKNLITSGNHQTVIGVNNSAVSGPGLVVGTGNPNDNTKLCNGLQVTAQGIKVPVYEQGAGVNANPIGYGTNNIDYNIIRVYRTGTGTASNPFKYGLEVVTKERVA